VFLRVSTVDESLSIIVKFTVIDVSVVSSTSIKDKLMSDSPNHKVCPECKRDLPIKRFQGFKTKKGYHRSVKCRDCAAKRDVTDAMYEKSSLLGLKTALGRLSDRYDELNRAYGILTRDFDDFKAEVFDGFKLVNEKLEAASV
jgi:hypothetical protein